MDRTIVFVGKDVETYRRITLKHGMESEHLRGMKLTAKAPSCFTIVKREEGFRGNRLKIYTQFCKKYGLEPRPGMEEKKCQIKAEPSKSLSKNG